MSDESDEIEDGHIFTSGQHLWSPETKKMMASLPNLFADVPPRESRSDEAESATPKQSYLCACDTCSCSSTVGGSTEVCPDCGRNNHEFETE